MAEYADRSGRTRADRDPVARPRAARAPLGTSPVSTMRPNDATLAAAEMLNTSPRVAQLQAVAATLAQGREAPPAPNRTGMPDRLKTGIEALSGMAMDDVRVHRNSSAPAQIQAHAFTQGTDIHLAPGQEQHLPHEAWHVVQQKQGRVRATRQLKGGAAINDDARLEHEADVMGQTLARGASKVGMRALNAAPAAVGPAPLQGYFYFVGGKKFVFKRETVESKMDRLKQWRSLIGPEGPYRNAVLETIRQWADSNQDEGSKGNSYARVIAAAFKVVMAQQPKASAPTSSSLSSRQTMADPRHLRAELARPEHEKIERLATLRRQASLEARDLQEFRDKRNKQHLIHPADPKVTHGIASTNNFMLGGNLPPTYKQLIKHIQDETGTNGAELAEILLAGLRGKPILTENKAGVAKFVTLVHGPEFRRAAINPLSVQVVLMGVIRNGGDVFTALSDNVLLTAPEPPNKKGQGLGGSKQSQYHREGEPDDERFRLTAANEYDAFVRAAEQEGYDVTQPEQMNIFITAMMWDHVLAHKIIYRGAVQPALPARKEQWSNAQLTIGLAVVLGLVAVIIALIYLSKSQDALPNLQNSDEPKPALPKNP